MPMNSRVRQIHCCKFASPCFIFSHKLSQSCKNVPTVPTSQCCFFLAHTNFWEKHAKNYAAMSILLVVLAPITVLISLMSAH